MTMRITTNLLLALTLLVSCSSFAKEKDFLGNWILSIGGLSRGNNIAYLTIELADDGKSYQAYIDNGILPTSIKGDTLEMDLDWRTGFDTTHVSHLTGKINKKGELEGVVDHMGQLSFMGNPLRNGTWNGRRAPAKIDLDKLPPDPVDLTGIWGRAPNNGAIRRVKMSMTPKGQGIVDNFLEMDSPGIRCAGYGMITASGLPYSGQEIFQSDKQVTILYGADYIRRIYLDGREFPDTLGPNAMGFSTGEWKGQTLVVTTTRFTEDFLSSTGGHPMSENAKIVEHYYLDDVGLLHNDIWVHDAENYARPPFYARVKSKKPNNFVITKTGCDPYSFFRSLDLGEELDIFWGRSEFRR